MNMNIASLSLKHSILFVAEVASHGDMDAEAQNFFLAVSFEGTGGGVQNLNCWILGDSIAMLVRLRRGVIA